MGRIGDGLNYPDSGVWNIADVYRFLRRQVIVPAVVQAAGLWLDAADLSTITESGGDVSQWNNKGTLGNFTQAVGASQPKTGVGTLNGLNVIDFDSDFMTAVNTNEWKFLHDGTDYIVAAVVQFGTSDNPNDAYGLIGNNSGRSDTVGTLLFYDDRSGSSNNNNIGVLITNGSAQVVSNITANDYFPANSFGILTTFNDPDNATAANRGEIYRDNGTAIKNNTQTAAVSSSNPAAALHLGASGPAANLLTGKLAELVIVSGADATEGNRVVIRNYLNAKWDVF